MNKTIYVAALHENGQILQETYETVSFACELKEGKITLLVLADGDRIDPLAEQLARKTGLEVVGIKGCFLREYCAEAYTKALSSFLKGKDPDCVCIPHTAQGADFAPQLSIALQACCITAVEEIGKGSFIRTMFGGKFRVKIRPSMQVSVLTVLPGAWKPYDHAKKLPGEVRIINFPDEPVSARTHGIRESTHKNMALSDAEVIVSAGRGIGKQENIRILRDFCSLFSKSALGATRAVCDLGWLDYTHQIGITGNKVSPKLYVACGISGAAQHLAGMKDSRTIIAVNADINASIFRVAHYGVVEDLTTFIPLLIETYHKGSKG